MNARALIFCATACLLACSCSTPGRKAAPSDSRQSDFEATISAIKRTHPASPALLNAQLGFGEFLLSRAQASCAGRVVLAQEQLGSVDANPETQLMYPDGWARAADLEYRLHLARAQCGNETDHRGDLLAAVAAARRAVDLYRNSFDYQSMVVMQFDAGIALRQIGDNAAALTALGKALEMDREYGFEDDARDNYKLFLTWQGKPADAARVAALLHDFPKRQAVLEFGWHATRAQVSFETRRECLKDGQVIGSHSAAVFDRRIGIDSGGGWDVSYSHRVTGYEPGVWPSEREAHTVFPPVPLPALAFKVSTTGEFQGATDSKALATQLIAKADALIKAGAPSGEDAGNLMRDAVETAAFRLSPGMLEAATAENYQLETAMWIGAKLDQGVWYEMSAPLSLPGMPEFVVQQHIEFAFTRRVACSAEATTRQCVEIVLHTTPDKDALSDVIADLTGEYPGTQSVSYDASTDARIVVDPDTLLPYAREEQTYYYASLGKGTGESVLWSEHSVWGTRYEAH